MPYVERLKKLKLPTLTYRRLRGDLIEIYKILTGKYDPEVCEGFIELRRDNVTRGNPMKIFKEQCRHELMRCSFPHRVVNVWNDIPANIAQAKTVISFEILLDRFLIKQDLVYDYKAKYNRLKNSNGTGNQIESELYSDLVQEA